MSLESFFQTESGKDEKEAYGKSYEERIKRKLYQAAMVLPAMENTAQSALR